MTSSCDAVLQTPELLQETLLHLDMRTLLTAAQRVSRQWHELITTSPALQQTLYFAPITSASAPATQNPLLSELFPCWFREEESGRKDANTSKPVLIDRKTFSRLPMAEESRRHAFLYPKASWRHMLVRQPPVLTLGRWTTNRRQGGDGHNIEIDEVPDGLRMGPLYDLAQHWVRRVVSHFVVFWGPSAVDAYTACKEKKQLQALSKRADLTVLRDMVAQCCGESPDEQYEEAFTFPILPGQGDN